MGTSERVTVRDGNRVVTIVPADGQTPADVKADLARSFNMLDDLRHRGVDGWGFRYRRFGSLRVAYSKEVGPPPWRFPRVRVTVSGSALSLGVGWRSTCHGVHAVWKKPPS